MKKFYLGLLLTAVTVAAGLIFDANRAQAADTEAISTTLVISQFQAGGATADDEFVEIHNVSSSPIDLNGYRIVYRSASGTNDVGPFAVWTTSTIIQPGQFYLIASTAYDGAATPDVTYNPGVCFCSMAAGGGGLAIRQGAQNTGTIIDSVGWGTASNIFVEGSTAPAPGNNNSDARNQNGCRDTDNNLSDFFNSVPSAPRNTSSATVSCGVDPTQLLASITASPSTVLSGGTTLLAVTVTPATVPPSTNITVSGNLSDIGGAASQPFFDDGTNGDVTAGDNVFSYLATVPVSVSPGLHFVVAAAADGQGRVAGPLNQQISVISSPANEDPLLFGNPSGATTNVANENNYLMVKPQYTHSHNRAKNTANWVAWRLDTSWIGTENGNDDWRSDTSLPAGWYRVINDDYDEPVYDRGHSCPAGDRTNTAVNNSATYIFTNIIPQLPENNQGPWNDFENYCRTLAQQGNEVYIFMGPHGSIGTIGSSSIPANRITVPKVTWKVVIVLPNGSNDLLRVNRSTRAFGIIVPNQLPLNGNAWRNYRVTVNAVEYLTGYDFFSAIPKNTQEIIERRRDKQ